MLPARSVITLLSDFGLKDPYVAEMKGRIISLCPNAYIIDISHEIEKFNIRMGAFILAQAAPFFPEGTIHIAVVDPGVGTKRKSIIIETSKAKYVGPDNGLLMLAAMKEKILRIHEISNNRFLTKGMSQTFHGRDIFSPVAASLACGASPSEFGPMFMDPIIPGFVKPINLNGEIVGEIIYVDRFGNLITNITRNDLGKVKTEVSELIYEKGLCKKVKIRIVSTYGNSEIGSIMGIFGGTGFLEISANKGSASLILDLIQGDKVILR